MKLTRIYSVSLLLTLLLNACSMDVEIQDQEVIDADVIITMRNTGSSAWQVIAVQGADNVAQLNTNNTEITFEIGKRYYLENLARLSHPLVLKNAAGQILLAQSGNTDGSFQADQEVKAVKNLNGLFFTVSPGLAQEMAVYACGIHGNMQGAIQLAQ